MTGEEFVEAAKGGGVDARVTDINSSYALLVDEYIKEHSPVLVGSEYQLKTTGVRSDLLTHMRSKHTFIPNRLSVVTKPDGFPLIVSNGDILKNKTIVDSFQIIVHGSPSVVTFEQFKKK